MHLLLQSPDMTDLLPFGKSSLAPEVMLGPRAGLEVLKLPGGILNAAEGSPPPRGEMVGLHDSASTPSRRKGELKLDVSRRERC